MANDIILLCDESGRIIDANERALKVYGYTYDELQKLNIKDLRTAELQKTFKDDLTKIKEQNGLIYETEHRRKDGSKILLEESSRIIKVEDNKYYQSFYRDITGHKQAERELRESRDALENIFKVSPDVIMLTDEAGNIVSINAAAEKMLGYSPEDLAGKHCSILGPNEEFYRRATNNMMAELLEKGAIQNQECYWRNKQGDVCPVECSSVLLKNDKEDLIGGVAFVRDIAERKAALKKEQESRKRLEKFIENSIDPIIMGDNAGRVVKPNKSFQDMTGYSADELIGKKVDELSVTETGEYTSTTGEVVTITENFFWDSTAKLVELLETGKLENWETYYMHKTGVIIPILQNLVLIYNEQGTIDCSFSVMRDLTEQKKAEDQLRQSEENFRVITEISLDAIITTDNENIIVFCNPATEKMFGYSMEELLGQPADMLLPDQLHEQNKNSFETSIKKGAPHLSGKVMEFQGLKKGGGEFPIELSVISYFIGDSLYFTTTVRDVSERKKLEEKIRQGEKMEAVGMLAGGVAHDLNNILSALVGYPDILLLKIPEDNSTRKPLLAIKSAGEKAAAIVNDLLTLSRRGINVSEAVNLNTLITELLDSQQHAKVQEFHPGVEFEINLAPDLLNILGSPMHLSKTVMNLISNAAEAIADSGRIVITTENRYLDKPITAYERIEAGDYAVIMVKDTGVGISAEDLQKIYEPFYTKKKMGRSGTGLGLAIVWGTVMDHKGYIEVMSEPGKGTTFTLYFPATRQEIDIKKESQPIEKYTGNGECVLVVDDIDSQREIASSLLQKLNYTVETVASGEEAIEYLKSKTADLIVLDMIMDPGIDGLETYQRILEIAPTQKVIIASGFSETDRVKKAQDLGIKTYIKKPYSLEIIGMAVKNELTRRNT